jgi:hypothetical protein
MTAAPFTAPDASQLRPGVSGAAQEIHPMPVVTDGDIGRKPMPWRAKPVQVESNCSCSHGPVGRCLVREAARRWTGHRPVATTPLMIPVKFALSWRAKKGQYEPAATERNRRSGTWRIDHALEAPIRLATGRLGVAGPAIEMSLNRLDRAFRRVGANAHQILGFSPGRALCKKLSKTCGFFFHSINRMP